MLNDYSNPQLKLEAPAAAASSLQSPHTPSTSHYQGTDGAQVHPLSDGAMAGPSAVSPEPAVRPKHGHQAQRHHLGPELGSQLTPTLPVLSPHSITPAKTPIFPGFGAATQPPLSSFDVTPVRGSRHQTGRLDYSLPSVISPADAPVPQPSMQTLTTPVPLPQANPHEPPPALVPHSTMQAITGPSLPPQANPYGHQVPMPPHSTPYPIPAEMQGVPQPFMTHPITAHYSAQPTQSSSQGYNGYPQSTLVPQAPLPSYQTPLNTIDTTPTAGHLPQLHTSPTPVHYSQDPVIGPVLHFKSRNHKPRRSERVGGSGQVCLLLKEWRRLVVKEGIMYRCIQDGQRGTVVQLVLPETLRTAVKTALHDESGHLGFERTLQMIRERFYWPRMFQEIKAWCEQCERCCLRKTPTSGLRAPLVSIHSSAPMELVCVDFLSLEKSKGGIENVLIVTDHFSRYAQAYPTKDQKASTVAKVLWKNFFCRFGFPAKLHADQGRNFESAIVRELCKCTGITKTHTTPYHPQGNGTTERFNRTLLNMLGTLEPHLKPRWHEHLDAMTHAYNCTRHDSTGFTPYYLMFGRHPRLPVDLIFGFPSENKACGYSDYVQTLHECLSQAYAQANQMSRHAKGQQKKYYDQKAKSQVFSPGDRVLVKVCHVEGRQKLGDRWEPHPYIVVKKQPNIPVYVVRLEGGGAERVVHRNLLTQCMFLPVERVSEVVREEAEPDMDAGDADTESDTAEDWGMAETEESVERALTETTDGQDGHTSMENMDAGQTREEEERNGAVEDDSAPVGPSSPRRNPPRNRRLPKKLCCESQVMNLESDQQKIRRGWELWQRVKASRAAGHI